MAKNAALAESPDLDLPAALERLGKRYLRPVFLIFDQFEELLISGKPEEREQFILTLQTLLRYSGETTCHILLILREEYLAALYGFEKAIPGLFDRRLRVEPMHRDKLTEVIRRSCAAFNISLEDAAANPELILENLGAGKDLVALPHLQVYLDMLYREDFQRDYPGGFEASPELPYPPLTFTGKEIEDFGRIDDVLEKFLDNIEQALRPTLIKNKWPEDALAKTLDSFVTDDATKRAFYFDKLDDKRYAPREKAMREKLAHIPGEALKFCLLELERNRLLHISDDTAELAHDSLAAVLDNRRTDEERRLNEARQRIRNAMLNFEQTGEYLSRKQLNSLELVLPDLRLEEGQQKFVSDSISHVTSRERRTRILNLAIGTILLAATAVSFLFFLRAESNQQQAQNNLDKFQQTQAGNLKKESAERLSRAAQLRRRPIWIKPSAWPAISISARPTLLGLTMWIALDLL